jgi:hypothetical protein
VHTQLQVEQQGAEAAPREKEFRQQDDQQMQLVPNISEKNLQEC